MSFLDESSATLQEALAFIDAHDSPQSSSVSASTAVQRKPRKSPKLGYWQRLRAEGDSLREQATALETNLKRLQDKAASHIDTQPWMQIERSGPEMVTYGQTLAEREYEQRLRAESTNQGLRGLIAKNVMTIQALATISFQKDNGSSPAALSVLEDQAKRLESQALAILDRVGLLHTDSFLFRTQREIDAQLGTIVESVSSTPLGITKQQADVALWRRFMVDVEQDSGQPTYTTFTDGGFTKAYPSTFAFGRERFRLTSHMLLRRCVKADTVLYIWTAYTLIPKTTVAFIEESLITVRDPSSSQSVERPALLQCWYRVHSKERAVPGYKSHDGAPANLELLKENAMRLRSNMGMSYIQSLESLLLDEISLELADDYKHSIPSCASFVHSRT